MKDLTIIEQNQLTNTTTLATQFTPVPRRIIELWIKDLKDDGKIEFRGAKKTGEYYVR